MSVKQAIRSYAVQVASCAVMQRHRRWKETVAPQQQLLLQQPHCPPPQPLLRTLQVWQLRYVDCMLHPTLPPALSCYCSCIHWAAYVIEIMLFAADWLPYVIMRTYMLKTRMYQR